MSKPFRKAHYALAERANARIRRYLPGATVRPIISEDWKRLLAWGVYIGDERGGLGKLIGHGATIRKAVRDAEETVARNGAMSCQTT